MPERAVNPREILLEQGNRLAEVAAPHIGLTEIEACADFQSSITNFARDITSPRAAFDAGVELPPPIVYKRSCDVDGRQSRPIFDRIGQGFSFGEIKFEPA